MFELVKVPVHLSPDKPVTCEGVLLLPPGCGVRFPYGCIFGNFGQPRMSVTYNSKTARERAEALKKKLKAATKASYTSDKEAFETIDIIRDRIYLEPFDLCFKSECIQNIVKILDNENLKWDGGLVETNDSFIDDIRVVTECDATCLRLMIRHRHPVLPDVVRPAYIPSCTTCGVQSKNFA